MLLRIVATPGGLATRKRDSSNTKPQASKLIKPEEKAPTARIISDTKPAKGRHVFARCVTRGNCSSVVSCVDLVWYTKFARKPMSSTRMTNV